jgi:cyclopropane fatty-acyl-phospholipid synthase-like methyltransferase
MQLAKGSTLLDVASSAGYVAAAAASRGAHATGLDFDQAQVELVRSLYQILNFVAV